MQACLSAGMDHKSPFKKLWSCIEAREDLFLKFVVCMCITGLMVVHLVELRGLRHYSIILHPCVKISRL